MRSLAESGIQVATSAGGFDQQTICESLRGVPVCLVALRCSEESRRKRLAVEPHKRPIASLDRTVADVHTGWTYDLELDTDEATPHQLAARVVESKPRLRVAANRPSQSCRRDSPTPAIAQKSFRRA
jgi:chloramphenicol 3-O-phosphotransferase